VTQGSRKGVLERLKAGDKVKLKAASEASCNWE
jgi:hypothetical protein